MGRGFFQGEFHLVQVEYTIHVGAAGEAKPADLMQGGVTERNDVLCGCTVVPQVECVDGWCIFDKTGRLP